MEAIHVFLENVKLGGKQSHQNMALFPLLASDAGKPDYLTMEEGLAQGMIWEELAEKSARMNVRSTTGAMADLFDGQKDRLSEYLKPFHLVDSQVGALFAINAKVVGLECFAHWQTFSKFLKKLVQSYAALDAIDMFEEPKTDHIAVGDIKRFMEGVRNAPGKSYPSLGLGENIRADGPFVSGAALIYKETVLHLSVFSHEGRIDNGPKVPFQRFSQRRRKT